MFLLLLGMVTALFAARIASWQSRPVHSEPRPDVATVAPSAESSAVVKREVVSLRRMCWKVAIWLIGLIWLQMGAGGSTCRTQQAN